MKPTSLALCGLTIMFATSSALAADAPKTDHKGDTHPPRHFELTDTNHDGAISKDEWRAKGDTMFAEIDANHDGKLTEDEMKAAHQKRRAEWKAKHGTHEGRGEKPADVPAGK